jgi:2-oxoglutarate/2-oxoacid ferredoxin oxidoreductase subunit alpha
VQVVRAAFDWAAEHLDKRDPFRVEPMNATSGLLLMTGNEAGRPRQRLRRRQRGRLVPDHPVDVVRRRLREYLPELRHDPEGRPTYSVIQAEDELAAIGMVIGAGFAGARALTATSGPGLSLMAEFAGLAYYAEVPAVIWDVQRVGPSTGLPTRTGQGDLGFAYDLGHGDTKHIVLLPSSIEECFEFGWRAHDLADELQTPVFVLTDLDLGMNTWMGAPFSYPDEPLRRGKVLTAGEIEQKGFARYADVDGDGMPWRTLPGNAHPASAYFARGTGHDAKAVYSERAEDWVENMARLARKYETVRTRVPSAEVDRRRGRQRRRRPLRDHPLRARGGARPARRRGARLLDAASARAPDGRRGARLPRGAPDTVVVLEMNHDAQVRGSSPPIPRPGAPPPQHRHLDGLPFTAGFVADRLRRSSTSKEA